MRAEGTAAALAELLFPDGLVPQILVLLVETWQTFKKPTNDEDEPKITNRFARSMQQRGTAAGLKFRVMPHVKELEDLDESTGRGFAEIDILVPHGYDYRCYFGIEAKKLITTSDASSYADKEGMGRLVKGRYAPYQLQGGMVAYVMNGDCAEAKSDISMAIAKRARELRVTVPVELTPSRHLPDLPTLFETVHGLERGNFTIHHVLLAA
jgi:hypothetical protein